MFYMDFIKFVLEIKDVFVIGYFFIWFVWDDLSLVEFLECLYNVFFFIFRVVINIIYLF